MNKTTNATSVLSDSTFQEYLKSGFNMARPLQVKKQQSWDQFNTLPFPTGKDERWRYSKLHKTDISGFNLPTGVSTQAKSAIIEQSKDLQDVAGTIITANNHMLHATELPKKLVDEGVIWLPLQTAFEKHHDLMDHYFNFDLASLGSEKYLAMHHAYAQGGAVLYVPENVVIEKPLVVYHWIDGENSTIFPTTSIVAGVNSKVSVVEFYLSTNPGHTGLSCGFSRVVAGDGANVFKKSIQNFNEKTHSYHVDLIEAYRDSQVTSLNLNLGGTKARHENQIHMHGEGGHAKLYSLTVAEEDQVFDQRTLQVHHAPNACSDLLYKNALQDESQTIFSGLIRVEEGAQQTDAYQTNRNLLLSPKAEANALPGLQISANDVKCSHGATSGQLDESEMFYMQSRGLPKKIAQELLVFGFFEEVIEKIDSEELAENLRQRVQNKFKKKKA